MAELFENSGDPDQTPYSVASYLGLQFVNYLSGRLQTKMG